MMIRFCLFLLAFFYVVPASANPPQYHITASYREAAHQIVGSVEMRFLNDSANPLNEVYLFLYPNIYLEEKAGIPREEYRKAYPKQFNSGGMEIQAIQDKEGKPCRYSFLYVSNKKILMRVTLSTTLLPMEEIVLTTSFVTTLPEKRGIFGYSQDRVTLQGGWFPYRVPFVQGKWDFLLSPEESRFSISFTLPDSFKLISSTPAKGATPAGRASPAGGATAQVFSTKNQETTFFMEGEALPFYSLALQSSKSLEKRISPPRIAPIEISYNLRARNEKYAAHTMEVAEEAVSFFLKENGGHSLLRLQLVEADLYQDFVSPGTGILFVHSNIFKVASPLKRFHEASLAKGLYFLLWKAKIPWEEEWVVEMLAQRDARKFIRNKYGDINLSGWLNPFSFIPLIDDILYSNAIPLRQVYFSQSVSPFFKEDIRTFNYNRSEGIVPAIHLNTLLGHAVVEQAISNYKNNLSPHLLFRDQMKTLLSPTMNPDLDPLLDRWITTHSEIDFGIEQVRRERRSEGYYTSVLITKQGEGLEPVEIVLHQKNGRTLSRVWLGEGTSLKTVWMTPSPIQMIEIDPDHQLNDPYRLNNRYPHVWKVVLDRFNPGYNINTGVTQFAIGVIVQPIYDNVNKVTLDFSRADEGSTGGLTYSHLFLNHHVWTTGLSYISPNTQQGTVAKAPTTVIQMGYSIRYPWRHLPLTSLQPLDNTGESRYLYAGIRDNWFPEIEMTFNYGLQITGGGDSILTTQIKWGHHFYFSNYHEIGARFLWGRSFGSLFTDSRFFLGGENRLRGYTPLQFEGDNISFFSLEYRFPLAYDTDFHLAGFALTHTLQGAFFVDTGMVSDDWNTFRVNEFKVDAGAGIRWYWDFFGFYPSIFRVDVAYPIHSPVIDEKRPHYYVTAGQAF